MSGALLSPMILVLAVAAIVAAMIVAMATPSFAQGKSTNLYICTNDNGNFISNVSQSAKQETQAEGFRCKKQ